MDRQVKVIIRGLHMGEQSQDSQVETVVLAEYFQKNGSHYLFYQEKLEGFEQPVKNRIKFCPNIMELTRQGAVNVRMIFEAGKTHKSHYVMPYGELLLGIDTKLVTLKEHKDRIRVEVEYALELNGEHLSDNKMEILIQGK
ncbi:MAG: DUF1934 domain-containing protein [Acetatifactor sp.]|nr:DUF1934 domain-containing protein [Acetatifactor sp.]